MNCKFLLPNELIALYILLHTIWKKIESAPFNANEIILPNEFAPSHLLQFVHVQNIVVMYGNRFS
jgi:hypothetical protein